MAAVEPSEGLLDALGRLSNRFGRAHDRAAAECGVGAAQARMLRALGEGAPTITELAQRLGLDKSSTSGLVDRAHGRGLVRRVPSQLDRRSVRVRLSASGRELVAEMSARVDAELAAMLEPLTDPERAALSAALARLGG